MSLACGVCFDQLADLEHLPAVPFPASFASGPLRLLLVEDNFSDSLQVNVGLIYKDH